MSERRGEKRGMKMRLVDAKREARRKRIEIDVL